MFKTVYDYIDENRRLKNKIDNLKREIKVQKQRVILSESQNYCSICGNILNGYIPPDDKTKEKNE